MYLGVDQEGSEEIPTGEKSILPGEDEKTMTSLTIIRNCWGEQVISVISFPSKTMIFRAELTLFLHGTVQFTIASI